MKKSALVISMLLLLSGCNSEVDISSEQQKEDLTNCPESPSSLPVTIDNNFYDALNYRINQIVTDSDTIQFQGNNYNFIFCRGNETWTIQESTLSENSEQVENYEAYLAELANPQFQTVELNGKIYQYRVLLEPNPFPDFKQEAQQVIFQIIPPETQQPKKQVLYTLQQTRDAEAGFQLGVPTITATLNHNNQLFWAVSPEQGEGNGGIATIVSYAPESGEIQVIQPEEITKQQINDIAITGTASQPTFWIATQISGEGNPSLPSMGLVAYSSDFVKVYHVRNSPIVGAVPTQLELEEDWLWIATGNGICRLKWQTSEKSQSWNCWRFALITELPQTGLPLYSSLLSQQAFTTLESDNNNSTVEVLWWLPTDFETSTGRYEIKYDQGLMVELENQGAIPWSEFYSSSYDVPSWQSPLYWSGMYWHWNGNLFERGFDEVAPNFVGGGIMGIGSQEFTANSLREMYAVRGDLDLLNLSRDRTKVKYYSVWTDDSFLEPKITIVEDEYSQQQKSNPLEVVTDYSATSVMNAWGLPRRSGLVRRRTHGLNRTAVLRGSTW